MKGQTDSTVALAAIIATAVVGVLAPVLAGFFGRWQQTKQHEHDRDQLRLRLDAEAKGQAAELASERASVREEQRRSLLLQSIEDARAYDFVLRTAVRLDGKLADPDRRIAQAVDGLSTTWSKLLVFFDEEHSLIKAFDVWSALVGQRVLNDGYKDAAEAIESLTSSAWKEFEREVRLYVAEQPDSSASQSV